MHSLSLGMVREGWAIQSTDTNNATATATKAAIPGQTHYMMGVAADYSAAVTAIKTITVKKGTTTIAVLRWDFTNGPFMMAFPAAIRGDHAAAVSVELAASGTAGTNGRVTVFGFTE